MDVAGAGLHAEQFLEFPGVPRLRAGMSKLFHKVLEGHGWSRLERTSRLETSGYW